MMYSRSQRFAIIANRAAARLRRRLVNQRVFIHTAVAFGENANVDGPAIVGRLPIVWFSNCVEIRASNATVVCELSPCNNL